jgi:hypothetical protein
MQASLFSTRLAFSRSRIVLGSGDATAYSLSNVMVRAMNRAAGTPLSETSPTTRSSDPRPTSSHV